MLTQILQVGKQNEPTSALQVYVVLESETFFVSLEEHWEAGGEAGGRPSDLDSRFASSVTLPRARDLPQQSGVCRHLPREANRLAAQKVL